MLVQSILEPLTEILQSQTEDIAQEFVNVRGLISKLTVDLVKITGEILELKTMVEDLSTSTSSGPKRPVRQATTKTPVATNPETFPQDKIKNAMLYTRYMWSTDPAFRHKYGGGEDLVRKRQIKNIIDTDESVMKKEKEKAPAFERGLAEGMVLWKVVLKDEKNLKDQITAEFKTWDAARERAKSTPPLDEDTT